MSYLLRGWHTSLRVDGRRGIIDIWIEWWVRRGFVTEQKFQGLNREWKMPIVSTSQRIQVDSKPVSLLKRQKLASE